MTLDQKIKMRPMNYRQTTAAQLISENPVLPIGMIAREKDTNRWKIGDGVTAYNSLPHAIDGGSTIDKVAVTGATTLDAREGSVFTLALTGNVTGFTFSNLVNGKAIEVHFVQDATGSRTLAVNTGVVKLAGGALTLTTAASKRDVVRFRVIGNVAVEISRSLNI